MAASPKPLVWDFYRQADETADSTGGELHYFTEESQSLYLRDGIQTTQADVPLGHWKDAEPGEESQVSDVAYSRLELDHPANGVVYATAILPNVGGSDKLYLLRYVYAKDIGTIVERGSWRMQVDNPIAQMDLTLMNVGAELFTDDASLFCPGAKLSLSFQLGPSRTDTIAVGIAWIDDISFDELSPTVPISGRNSIGFLLSDQTFDTTTYFPGTADEVAAAILEYFGITKHDIQAGGVDIPFTFKPSDTGLYGMQQVTKMYSSILSTGVHWEMEELPDGTVIMGYEYFRSQRQPRSYYVFDGGREVFRRKTTRCSDAAYTHIYCTGKDADGNELDPVYQEIPYWQFWSLGQHRTYHAPSFDGHTQEELQNYADDLCAAMQYVGIQETFTGPLRPQLLVGDVASVYYGSDAEESTGLGIITEVKHSFGRKGFSTEFTLDSGGSATDASGYIVTSSAALSGDTRRKRVLDFIRNGGNS